VEADRLEAVEVPDPLGAIEKAVVGERLAAPATEDELEAALGGASAGVDQRLAQQSAMGTLRRPA